MVGIAQILAVRLPVAVDALALVAEDLDRLLHQLVKMPADHRSEVVLKALAPHRKRAEYDAAVGADSQLPKPMFALVEIGRHAALAVDAPLERHAAQVAVQVIVPAVVDACMTRVVARKLATH